MQKGHTAGANKDNSDQSAHSLPFLYILPVNLEKSEDSGQVVLLCSQV